MEFLCKNDNVLTQPIEDRLIIRTVSGEILTLNETAKFIFRLCDHKNISEIYNLYISNIEDYKALDSKIVKEEFDKIIDMFKNKKIIEVNYEN